MIARLTRVRLLVWQCLFLLLSTTWLLAPSLNSGLSDRTTLISEYETAGQAYAIFFRLGDFLAGVLLIGLVLVYFRHKLKSPPVLLLLLIGIGIALDPIFTTTCVVKGHKCVETTSLSFFIHATETVVTAASLLLLALYDAKVRHRLASAVFAVFQIAYGLLFLTQYADEQHLNTIAQYTYQALIIVWLAWFVRDYLFSPTTLRQDRKSTPVVRYLTAYWVLLNGLVAIVLSLRHIHLFGRFQNLYFAQDTAWLAQHGIIAGIIMLYLSRHLVRGERRARQLLLIIIGVEVIKYATITPSWPFTLLYGVTFSLLFVALDDFQRGSVPLTWQLRLKDLTYVASALSIAALLAFIVLDRDSRVSQITSHSFQHFSYNVLHSDKIHRTHRESVLLTNATTAFIAASAGTILWILFRPSKLRLLTNNDSEHVRHLLRLYSNSSEDYFKLWPTDKQYYWSDDRQGFIAYKIVGSVAFALADPICEPDQRSLLAEQFVQWAQSQRLRACFVPVTGPSLSLYSGLNSIQIGASALVSTGTFVDTTIKGKWWRWKLNRATKLGYKFAVSTPPHQDKLRHEVTIVSDSWLGDGSHKERGFALGYFNIEYMQQCTIAYLTDSAGQVVAFANLLPIFADKHTATVDLMRYKADAKDAMPYLLAKTIEVAQSQQYPYFDLGFVPFTNTKGPLFTIAKTLSAGRFSAVGLEQFKNKFDPEWQKVYLAYDGDIADLAVIAMNIESVMEIAD